MVLGLWVWVLLQALALAYARGAGGKPPASRHMDTTCLVMVAVCATVAALVASHGWRPRRAGIFYAVTALWLIGCGAGLWQLTGRSLRVEIPKQELDQQRLLLSTRTFLQTDSADVFMAPDLQVPPLATLTKMLRAPEIRRILPGVEVPAPAQPNTGWLSVLALQMAAAWKFVLAAGIALFAANLVCFVRAPRAG